MALKFMDDIRNTVGYHREERHTLNSTWGRGGGEVGEIKPTHYNRDLV